MYAVRVGPDRLLLLAEQQVRAEVVRRDRPVFFCIKEFEPISDAIRFPAMGPVHSFALHLFGLVCSSIAAIPPWPANPPASFRHASRKRLHFPVSPCCISSTGVRPTTTAERTSSGNLIPACLLRELDTALHDSTISLADARRMVLQDVTTAATTTAATTTAAAGIRHLEVIFCCYLSVCRQHHQSRQQYQSPGPAPSPRLSDGRAVDDADDCSNGLSDIHPYNRLSYSPTVNCMADSRFSHAHGQTFP